MEYALHAGRAPDGRLFEVGVFTQRLLALAGSSAARRRRGALRARGLRPRASSTVPTSTTPPRHRAVRPGRHRLDGGRRRPRGLGARPRARAVAAPTPSSTARRSRRGRATAGRQFVLGATPEVGCDSVTQFVGLIPPGRAPDHFHRYDEVIYVLEGEGDLEIGGEQAPLRRRRVRAPAAHARAQPREHRRRRAARARRLPAGRLAGRGVLPRRHARRRPRRGD